MYKKFLSSFVFIVSFFLIFGFWNNSVSAAAPIHAASRIDYVRSTSVSLWSSFDPQKLNSYVWFELDHKPGEQFKYKAIGRDYDPTTEFCVMNYFEVTGLTPETTYRARAAGKNSSGVTYGPWITFVTLPESETNRQQDQVTTGDLTPRIALWYGKVNQHIDENGFWRTDPNGSKGVNDANVNQVEYCKKWYPNTTYVKDYKLETISTWKRENIYEQSDYESTVMSRECKTGAPPPEVSLTISEDSVVFGGEAALSWNVNNADSCKASDGWTGDKDERGGDQLIKNITGSKTFTITCSNKDGISTDSVSVSIVPPPSVELTASTSSVLPGETVYLRWSVADAKNCEATSTPDTSWSGPKNLIMVTSGAGSEYVSNLTEDTIFTLTCDPTVVGPKKSVSVTVTVGALGPIVNLSASPMVINQGDSASLTWTSTNAVSCVAGGDWEGSQILNSTEPLVIPNITSTKVFTLTCKNSKGEEKTSETSVSVTLKPIITLSADPANVSYNGSTFISWKVLNSTSCTASDGWTGNKNVAGGSQPVSGLKENTIFTLTCTGPGGQDSQSLLVKVGATTPSVTISANPTSVPYDGSTSLSWSTSNVTSCTASDGWTGIKDVAGGSQIISNLKQNTKFTLTCKGPGGTIAQSVPVAVGSAPDDEIDDIEGLSLANTRVIGGKTSLRWTVINMKNCKASTENPTSGLGWEGTKKSDPNPYTGVTNGVLVTAPDTTDDSLKNKYIIECDSTLSKAKLKAILYLDVNDGSSSGNGVPTYQEN